MNLLNYLIKPSDDRTRFYDSYEYPHNKSSYDWMRYLYDDLSIT
jgi:hypothetical protein